MSRPLRIGVNALYLIPGGVGGTEVYLRNLLPALAGIDRENEYFVFLNRETVAAQPPLTPAAPNLHAVPTGVRAIRRPGRLLWEQVMLPLQAASRRLGVLFSPGFTSPVAPGCRNVTVIHDLQHKRQPQNFRTLELLAWRALVWASAHFSQRIITVSESSRADILDVYGLAPGQVVVIPHGVEPAFFHVQEDPNLERSLLAKAGLGDWPYLLSVSTIHPHKNWGRWLEAYGQLAAESFPQHLVVAGLQGNYAQEFQRQVENLKLAGRIHALGWVDRPLLRALFKYAGALVFPSTFEGFGMPVLEALAAGVPVACSDIPPLREVAGDAALFFDPYSAEAMAAGVRRILRDADLRGRLIRQGRERAANFTWTRAAEQTLAVLRKAAE